jgi:transcription termination factor Rho
VNGKTSEELKDRVEFAKLVPLYPSERLRLETDPKKIGPRVIDLVAPIGKGQRGLIVSPPKAGKTLILQSIANAITTNNPEVHLMMVLVDERPEETTPPWPSSPSNAPSAWWRWAWTSWFFWTP